MQSLNQLDAWDFSRLLPLVPRVCERAGVEYLGEVIQSLRSAKEQGIDVDFSPDDPHLTHEGNAIAGRAILRSLSGRGVVACETSEPSTPIEGQ